MRYCLTLLLFILFPFLSQAQQGDPYFLSLKRDVPVLFGTIAVGVTSPIFHLSKPVLAYVPYSPNEVWKPERWVTITTAEGVDPKDFVELLTNTLFGGVVYSGYGALIAERDYTPQAFSLELGLKDLGLAESLAQSAGIELPSSAVLREVFESALAEPDLVDKDWSALAEITLRHHES